MKKAPVKVLFDVPDAATSAEETDVVFNDSDSRERRMDAKWPSGLDINKLKTDLLHYVSNGLLLGGKQRATVALIKPDAVRDGLLKQIKKQIEESGLHIIAEAHKKLTKMEAITLYSKHSDKEYFEELTEFMSSGPAHVLVLVDDHASANAPSEEINVISRLRDVVGPTDVEEARIISPHSIRGMFATSMVQNAIHACADVDEAKRELLFFFPELEKAIAESTCNRMLLILLPDYLHRLDDLLDKLKEQDFEVIRQKHTYMSKDQAQTLYKHLEKEGNYNDMINYLIGGKIFVILMKKEHVIEEFSKVMGPEDVSKAQESAPDSLVGAWSAGQPTPSLLPPLYASRSAQDSARDQELFFPLQRTLAIIKPDALHKKAEILSHIKKTGFQIVNEMECVLSKEKINNLYQEHCAKDWFPGFVDFMTSGPSLCLILQKEDAIQDWREVIGPTDPVLAQEKYPNSLRAIYGTDVMHNALHGSSTVEQADHRVHTAFPKSALPTVMEDSEEKEEPVTSMDTDPITTSEDAAAVSAASS